MSTPYDIVATAYVNDTKAPRNARMFVATIRKDAGYIGGVQTTDPDAPRAVYSYGPHFPIAFSIDEIGHYVNETPYQVNEIDRDRMGWGPVHNPSRKRPASPTTRRHTTAVTDALTRAGFTPSAITTPYETEGTDGEPLPHTFRLWTRI